MIAPMRHLLSISAVLLATTAGGCGGGKQAATHTAAQRPVASQVREALVEALHGQALAAQPMQATRSHLPFVAVGHCAGPGRAGTYRCTTTPRGSRGVREVTVEVEASGQWSTRPLRVQTTLHGHPTSAMAAVWGVGLRVPR